MGGTHHGWAEPAVHGRAPGPLRVLSGSIVMACIRARHRPSTLGGYAVHSD